jgi:two-component system nitrogen regulation sensor histidine kinase NtrY
MSFRTKLFLLFLATVLASVSAVTYSVTHYTRAAYEEADTQRTQALVEQFQKEFAQLREAVARQVENVTNSEFTLKMAIDLERANADQSIYARDAAGAAQEHGLNFMEFVISDGTLISSAQYPARVGYKETWVTGTRDWNGSDAFLRREELPNEAAVALTAVRTQPNVTRPFYAIGGQRLDKNFLASLVAPAGMRTLLYLNLDPTFVPGDITAAGEVDQPERFAPIIAQIQKQPVPLVQTIQWTDNAESAESFHVLPLTGRNGELLGALLVGSSRRDLVRLTRHIVKLSAAVAAAAIFIGLLLTWWVSARITRPIEELAEGAREVAAGHWDTRINLRGRDETGQLATAFNNMTQTLVSQRERLVQTERVAAWRELARRLAHELRNPLFPLQITVENMQRARQLGPDQFQEVFNESTATLKAELANLNSIVNRFSDFSKMPPPEFSRVDINESIRNAVRLFEPQFHEVGKPNITTEYFLKEGLPDIDGDTELLHKAFQNLVLNALDAMPAGGTLTFRTSEMSSAIRIEVSDTGKGLTPEECSRLFTPYYTTKQQGTGLGLAIVQSVVSDHRGTISVASEEGHGTTFRIELPRRQPGVTTKKLPPSSAADQAAPAAPETAAASD